MEDILSSIHIQYYFFLYGLKKLESKNKMRRYTYTNIFPVNVMIWKFVFYANIIIKICASIIVSAKYIALLGSL